MLANINEDDYVNLQVLGAVYEGDYSANSKDYIFTIARNYLDNRSLTTSRTEILGTVYADIKVDILEDIVSRAECVKESSFHIVNLKNNQFIFGRRNTECPFKHAAIYDVCAAAYLVYTCLYIYFVFK